MQTRYYRLRVNGFIYEVRASFHRAPDRDKYIEDMIETALEGFGGVRSIQTYYNGMKIQAKRIR